MRKGKGMMGRAAGWVRSGSDAWFGLAAGLTSAITAVSIARAIGGQRLGGRRLFDDLALGFAQEPSELDLVERRLGHHRGQEVDHRVERTRDDIDVQGDDRR